MTAGEKISRSADFIFIARRAIPPPSEPSRPKGVSKCDTTIPESKKVQAPYGARVQAAIGLTPLADPVPPTERAGSEGVIYAACGSAP